MAKVTNFYNKKTGKKLESAVERIHAILPILEYAIENEFLRKSEINKIGTAAGKLQNIYDFLTKDAIDQNLDK